MFMPGTPQVWYLDIFAGKNDYEAADKGGSGGHKEINRTSLTMSEIEAKLKTDIVLNQLKLLKLRNTSQAFLGTIKINETSDNEIDIKWINQDEIAHLTANLKTRNFTIRYTESSLNKTMVF